MVMLTERGPVTLPPFLFFFLGLFVLFVLLHLFCKNAKVHLLTLNKKYHNIQFQVFIKLSGLK